MSKEMVENLARKFHLIERTLVKMTYETSPVNCSWEDLPEGFRNLYLQDATDFLPIIQKAEKDRMYEWLSVEWTTTDGRTATYRRLDIDSFFGKP